MSASNQVGTIEALWRFPVKSMLGEQLDAADLTEGGLVGDRAYAIRDRETGKVASAKHPKVWPDMFACRAAFVEPPAPGGELPAVRIELADGSSVTSDDPDVDDALTRFFGRDVELARSAQGGYTIDMYELAGDEFDPEADEAKVSEVALGAPAFGELGVPFVVPEGSFFDLFPLSVLTTSSLDHLSEVEPESRWDARRFRMNVIVDTAADGFVENGWVGRTLALGDDVRLGVAMPDPRCCMPNLAQEDLPRDPNILKALGRHNRLEVVGSNHPCAGVYAVAAATGTVRTGDPVALI